tara:strand:+ start:42745 stop:45648 length:2904 start_codon:yes stop_codon:yes gene_type:complete
LNFPAQNLYRNMMITRTFLALAIASLLTNVTGPNVRVCRADDFPTPYNTEPEPTSPMSAEQAAATAELPPGFRCEVFAAEPDVQQPIAMCFDDRARLWVAECFTYAEQPARWDENLRDRIVVLEDTDQDGRADKRKVFWDKAQRLTSIAHGNGGVYALCAPQLLFIPDKNGDDIPDSEPVVLLDGFEADSIGHNVVNGLKIGPDGWLYGRHGITARSMVGKPNTPLKQRQIVNCSIWRYHPQRETFEVVCRGGTNPWGLDWNADGQLFYTNTVIGHLWHAIPGAYYQRMHGAHQNPLVYDVISHTADHYHWDTGEKWSDIRGGVTDSTSEAGGGHAHMGCLVYNGGVWPDEYRGNLFTCNLHGRRINMDIIEREGCGYVAHHGKDFMMMKDPFFRGLDLLTGPDGQMWVSDWSDTGECHDNTGLHRTSGRIYRIVYEGPDKGTATPARPDWLTRRAAPSFAKSDIEALLESDDEAKRAMAVRWLAEDHSDEPATFDRLIKQTAQDSSGLVRLEIAAALQRLPADERIELASHLAQHAGDSHDRQQPLMVWYGIADVVSQYPEQAIDLAFSSKFPTVSRFIARRLCEQIDEEPQHIETLLQQSTQESGANVRQEVLHGMNDALRGRVRATSPKNWQSVSDLVQRSGSDEEREIVQNLSLLFGDGRARTEVLAIAVDQNAEANARRAAIKSLLRNPTDDLLPHLKEWTNDKVIARDAVRGLAHFDGPGISVRLINHWVRYAVNRSVAIDSLVSRPSHAKDLLDAIDKGRIPPDAISPYQARQINNLGDEELSRRLKELWGDVRESPEEKKRELEKWKSVLTPERITSADPVAGKAVFMKQCATCHQLYGDGKKVGPNLTGSDRHNLDYLLSNMIDPSSVVPADYRMSIFLLDDGRVISGVVTAENDRSINVETPDGQVVLDKETVTQRKPTSVSLMPEGQLTPLGEDAVCDLVAYLMTSSPIATQGESK